MDDYNWTKWTYWHFLWLKKRLYGSFSENDIATEDPWNPLKNDNFCKFGSKFHNFAYKCIGYSFLTIILFVGQIKIWIKCILKFDSYGTQIVLWSWSVVHTWTFIWNFLYQYISNCRCQKTPITPVRNQERAPGLLRECSSKASRKLKRDRLVSIY